jgi:hypothetical protein
MVPVEKRRGLDFLSSEVQEPILAAARAGQIPFAHLSPDCRSWSLASRGYGTRRKRTRRNDAAGKAGFPEGGRDGLPLKESEEDGNRQIEASVRLIKALMDGRAAFSFEQPKEAWEIMKQTRLVADLIRSSGLFEVYLDQCCYGLRNPTTQQPVLKPTVLVTNAEPFRKLERRCECQEPHGAYPSAVMGAAYPWPLAEAMAAQIEETLRP